MIIEDLNCPVCNNPLSNKIIEVNQEFICIVCASRLVVVKQDETIIILILENGRKIVWAPPFSWSDERRAEYHTNSQIKIKNNDWMDEFQRRSDLITEIWNKEALLDCEKRKRIIILQKSLLEAITKLDNELTKLENDRLTDFEQKNNFPKYKEK
jgi:hypothetical protein